MKNKNFLLLTIFTLSSFWLFVNQAQAQIVDSIYYGWTVYERSDENEERECYIGSSPVSSVTSHTGIRKPYILITRFNKSRSEEVSVYSGYEYKINSSAYILIGDQEQFRLFTNIDNAWANNSEEDKKIIQLMLYSSYFKIRSDSAIGTYAIDEYSTRGLARAYSRMRELCS